jgi:hypothetical protein
MALATAPSELIPVDTLFILICFNVQVASMVQGAHPLSRAPNDFETI